MQLWRAAFLFLALALAGCQGIGSIPPCEGAVIRQTTAFTCAQHYTTLDAPERLTMRVESMREEPTLTLALNLSVEAGAVELTYAAADGSPVVQVARPDEPVAAFDSLTLTDGEAALELAPLQGSAAGVRLLVGLTP